MLKRTFRRLAFSVRHGILIFWQHSSFLFFTCLFFTQTSNFQSKEEGTLAKTVSDAQSISSQLLLSGYPTDWTNTTVLRIGIADNNLLNITKLNQFHSLDYTFSRIKFGTTNDYLVFFADSNNTVLNINGTCGTGKPSVISDPIGGNCAPINITSKTELAKNERYIGHNSSIIKMVVYVWH